MRRDALNQLTAIRARHGNHPLGKPRKLKDYLGSAGMPGLSIQVTSREQITKKLLTMETAMLYVPIHILLADPVLTQVLVRRGNVAAVLPRIVHDEELTRLKLAFNDLRTMGVRDVLVGNLGLMIAARKAGFTIHGDFGLNIFNSRALHFCRELELASACLSFEMTLPQIRDLSKAVPTELIVYGRLPLMVTEHCLIRNRTGQCTCHQGPAKLTDKTGAEFPIIKDGDNCRSVLLNGKKLYWLDRQEDLRKLGVWAVRLYFTTENAQETDRVLSDFVQGAPMDPGAGTRGLYLRGLD
jgi:putative protease